MVLVQNWPFFQFFFLGNIGLETVFYDIRERKNAFLGYKTRCWKSRKIGIFPNGQFSVLLKIGLFLLIIIFNLLKKWLLGSNFFTPYTKRVRASHQPSIHRAFKIRMSMIVAPLCHSAWLFSLWQTVILAQISSIFQIRYKKWWQVQSVNV